jgi:hypothetical protein
VSHAPFDGDSSWPSVAVKFRGLWHVVLGEVVGAITADGIYKMVKHYAKRVGVNSRGWGASLRATAATMRLYDRRKTRPEDSPTFKVRY